MANTKQTYFNPEEFVQRVIDKAKLGQMEPALLDNLREQIAKILMERVVHTILAVFQEKELFMLKNMLDDHPELDEIDAIMIISAQTPEIDVKLQKTIDDLEQELLQDYANIKSAFADRDK